MALQGSLKEAAGNQDTLPTIGSASVWFPPWCNEGGETLTAPTMLEVATRRKRSKAVEAISVWGGVGGLAMQLFIADFPAGGVVRVEKSNLNATFLRYETQIMWMPSFQTLINNHSVNKYFQSANSQFI